MNFGAMMREQLQANGWTLRAACKAMSRDQAYPSRVMNGHEPPSRELARDLDRLLVTDRFTKSLSRPPRPASSDGDALAAIELARQASLSEVGTATIDLLEAAFDDLATRYQAVRPTELYPEVRDGLTCIGQLLGKRTTLREHLALLHFGGWYSLLAATLNVDIRGEPTARAQLRTAVSLAREAGTPVITAWALETRAWQALTSGDAEGALKLSQEAQQASPEGSSALIQATAQTGRAHARLGHANETRSAINRVETLAIHDPVQPRHHFSYDPAKQLSYTATALAWSGDLHAERAAREVLAAYPAEQSDHTGWPRRLATANLDLSLALAKKGDLDEGAGTLARVIESGRLVPSTTWRAKEVIALVATRLPDEASELAEALSEATKGNP